MNSKPAHPWKPGFRNLILPAVLFMASALAINAQNADVSTQSDLETAIDDANTGIVSTITFLNDIVLGSALPNLTSPNLTIQGEGYTLRRNPEALMEFRILNIVSGTVIINDLTISGGRATMEAWPDGFAGGVFSGGSLTMHNCTLSDNQAWNGGAVRTGDIGSFGPSGFYNCTFINNAAAESGGAAFISAQTTFENCTISGNIAATGTGGGIYSDAPLIMRSSTVYANSASTGYAGGGVCCSSDANFQNCTISVNSAPSGLGGGIYWDRECVLENCTVNGNSANNGGGLASGELATTTLIGCIVSGNILTSVDPFDRREISLMGFFASQEPEGEQERYNVIGHSGQTTDEAFSFTPDSTDRICTSDGNTPTPIASILDALANNGGSTLTRALVAGSPAIDIAPEGPATDQRGYARPYGSAFDAGSVEYGAGATPPGPTPDPTPTALLEEYEHHLVANTISPIHCDLDPNDILGASPSHTVSAGALPRHLGIEGDFLAGTFGSIGTYRFSVSSTGGLNEVRNHFIIQVIPPTLTPFISGVWVNDVYQPTIVQQERTHGDAALTELLNIHTTSGSPLRLVFDWDYIKHSYSFKIIRGSLPDGLTMRETVVDGLATAIIEGTPTTPGEYVFVVSVKDWRERGYQWIRLVVE